MALELRKKLLGESHPDVATSLNNLAAHYYEQGRYKKAEPFLKQALNIAEIKLGEHHPKTKIARNNLQILLDQINNKY
ncbi:MAG: tetratricopeptide repeat protein [Cyanobacteria bacterium P01_F01_bin.143]